MPSFTCPIRDTPQDLYSAKPLIYKRIKSGFLLYSIGENETDDGGHTYDGEKYVDQPNGQNDDLAIRVPPWPRANPDK